MQITRLTPERSWRRHRPLAIALCVALVLLALPGSLTRGLQSGWQVICRPGQQAAQATIALGRSGSDWLLALTTTAAREAENIERIATLEAELAQTKSQRDAALLAAAQARAGRNKDRSTLLAAQFVPARLLSPQAQALLGRQSLLAAGAARGVTSDALVVDPKPLLDAGTRQGLAAGQWVVEGRRVWGKVKSTGTWTSAACHVTDQGFRDVVLIASPDGSVTTTNTSTFNRIHAGSAVRGLLYGDGGALCHIRHVPAHQPVAVGDIVYSAVGPDLDCVLLCGKVVCAERPPAASDWEIWVEPAIARDAALGDVAVLAPTIRPERLAAVKQPPDRQARPERGR